jgi:hypothetical protein
MMKSIGIKKCDYSSFNFFTFSSNKLVLVYKLVSRLSGSSSNVNDYKKDITRKIIRNPTFLEMLNF